MPTIFEIKERAITETPLLLFDCELPSGAMERWSTHQVTTGGLRYEARILRHNLFEVQTSSDQGVDAIPRISIALANADSHFSQIERAEGWKGAKITVRFVFFDLKQNSPASEDTILFHGIANSPDEITESTFRITAINRMSMQRVLLPEVRLQRRCPWEFPSNQDQRSEALTGGSRGKYSRFYRCGYSAGIPDGVGNLNAGSPFTSCAFTRTDCETRGMFSKDAAQNITGRFGGVEFVPSSIVVRSYGEKGSHLSPLTDNEARYNDFVPLIYGTGWHSPSIVFSRNDGNLTRMEVLLGMGEIQGVVKVLVNDVDIPLGRAGANMTGTGWFGLISAGTRTGSFNMDFRDQQGAPLGDPYGSMAYLSVVVPNRINDGRSLPSIKVLIQGMKLSRYASDGSFLGEQFTNNPAWILLDILSRSGWRPEEIDFGTFAEAASYCDEEIQTQDVYGTAVSTARFQCNLVLKTRRTAADVIRGIRNASRLYLTYGVGGVLQLKVENTIALQQSSKPPWSNSTGKLYGGWPGYEFGDGSSGNSGIVRREDGAPSIRLWSRSNIDTPNRFSVEFQDAFNEYQQDSFSLVDVDDVARAGQEITGSAGMLGLPNYDQAARMLKFSLDKAIQGNTYVEFETSVRALGLRPGDLIALNYLKEGFTRQPFRVLKIAPGLNYTTAVLTAQIHKDIWYSDTNGQVTALSGERRQPDTGIAIPRPLQGSVVDGSGEIQFDVSEQSEADSDGGQTVGVTTGFLVPAPSQAGGPGIPLVNLAATIDSAQGTLAGNQTLYYAISAVDSSGLESALSFIVRAAIPVSTNTNSVRLTNLSFPARATRFNVFRGATPEQLFRIASNQAVTNQFTDSGLPKELTVPPDSNYDHANFYWRLEIQSEYSGTIHSANSVGNTTLQMIPNEYRGMIARITRGKGVGQERPVMGNTVTTLNLVAAWDIEPDATSDFVVVESSWHFGASSRTSPVQFEIPNRTGAVIHISGRAANVNNEESSYELSTLTRWRISGSGGLDSDVPPKPVFGLALSTSSGGTIELSGVGFPVLTNTRTIAAGTLSLYYWDELAGPSLYLTSAAMTAEGTLIDLTSPGAALVGSYLQVEAEIMRVEEVLNGGSRYRVSRAAHGTTAGTHDGQKPVYHLLKKVAIAPFVRDFFGSPASGSWSFPVILPDARVASAEFFVTNANGNSETAVLTVIQAVDYGLRTLSGGQFSIQVESFLAIQTAAAPDLVVEAPHSVRDVFAVVRQAPTDGPIELQLKQNGLPYCVLTVPTGAIISNSVAGFPLPLLQSGARITLDILSVGQTNPGSDLTVVIRL